MFSLLYMPVRGGRMGVFMKKLLAGVLAGGMLFQTAAFADTADDLTEILSQQYKSATIGYSARVKLEKPLAFLEEMQNAEEEEYKSQEWYSYYPGEDIADYRMLAEGLFDSTADLTVKVDASEDYKKIDSEISGNITFPAKVNESLKLTGDASFGMWLAMDFTDAENLKYDMTVKMPLSRKYIYIDYTKMMQEADLAEMGQVLDEEALKALTEKSKKLLEQSLRKSADIKKEGSKYIISFDNNGFIEFMENYMNGVFSLVKEISAKYSANADDLDFSLPPEIKEAIESLKKMNILGENGVTVEVSTEGNTLSGMKVLCDIDLNLYDIMTALGMYAPEYITKDNSYISFDAELDYKYSEIGSTKIDFPELNDKNCNYIEPDEPSEDDGNYPWYHEEEILGNETNGYALRGLNSVPYLYCKNMLADYAEWVGNYSMYDSYEMISWNDGKVIFEDKNGNLPFGKIVLDTRADEAYVDGVKLNLTPQPYKHIIVSYGNTYISPELAKALIGAEVQDYNVSFDALGNATKASVYYEYPNPNCKAQTADF